MQGNGAKLTGEPLDVRGNQRAEIGIDKGGCQPFVFPEFRQDLRGNSYRNRQAGKLFFNDLFMDIVGIGMQQADGNGFAPILPANGTQPPANGFSQGCQH